MTTQIYIDPMLVWADMKLKIWPGRYYMLYNPVGDAALVAEEIVASDDKYACFILDQGGVSATVDAETAERIERRSTLKGKFGPFRIVSTDGELPFNVIGFLRPALEVLNREGVKAGPQCGADFDHLFIYEDKIDIANELLAQFIASARENSLKKAHG